LKFRGFRNKFKFFAETQKNMSPKNTQPVSFSRRDAFGVGSQLAWSRLLSGFLIEKMNKEKICLNEVTDHSFNDEKLYQPQWNATEWPRQARIPQGQAE